MCIIYDEIKCGSFDTAFEKNKQNSFELPGDYALANYLISSNNKRFSDLLINNKISSKTRKIISYYIENNHIEQMEQEILESLINYCKDCDIDNAFYFGKLICIYYSDKKKKF